ncbi:hypothetical protein ASPZODRAFT_17477 [Penicilliopsis zonata CBS 506.65]|uniref:Uncharacterized protein n=1 Tax=Penicilliopsis zonata CBS 506.65 TaxID=1073090 RepID=A0A1L9SDH6_9EURO|nr:hypothetical protein ASPZODRAFT_17477 [Penicilliopsis zonata CBS 506.65]OJJ45256.1 hypothetical protein ASPZODRAFT_17477 [Penicilliopsis zonata CBS 506.65]
MLESLWTWDVIPAVGAFLDASVSPLDAYIGYSGRDFAEDNGTVILPFDRIPAVESNQEGDPNELIAIFAADKYACAKGVAIFITTTTLGPGEQSA